MRKAKFKIGLGIKSKMVNEKNLTLKYYICVKSTRFASPVMII